MTQQEQFINLVIAMREAQRDFFQSRTQKNLNAAVRLEQRVDEFLARYVAERVQLELWSRSARTDEESGAYNVKHEVVAESSSKK